jgi:hypothetical protein
MSLGFKDGVTPDAIGGNLSISSSYPSADNERQQSFAKSMTQLATTLGIDKGPRGAALG